MKKLILHIGPAKCGSSSIQEFFRSEEKHFSEDVTFKILNPNLIQALNKTEPFLNDIVLLKHYISDHDIIILSHEFLFQNPYAIWNICNVFEAKVAEIVIIGYSRKQSDFLVSAYSQWLFRAKERIDEVKVVLNEYNIENRVFNGLERQLIASICNDFYSARQLSQYNIMNWNQSYCNVRQLLKSKKISIKANLLPTKIYSFNLIEDFCKKCGIAMPKLAQVKSQKKVNQSFDINLIEAINCATYNNIDIVTPHEKNNILHTLSTAIEIKTKESTLLIDMKDYIDSYFFKENIEFSNRYQLNSDYFKPKQLITKSEIIEKVKLEERYRKENALDIIEQYQKLSGILAKSWFDSLSFSI